MVTVLTYHYTCDIYIIGVLKTLWLGSFQQVYRTLYRSVAAACPYLCTSACIVFMIVSCTLSIHVCMHVRFVDLHVCMYMYMHSTTGMSIPMYVLITL